jgi:two-component system LytT family response regulator
MQLVAKSQDHQVPLSTQLSHTSKRSKTFSKLSLPTTEGKIFFRPEEIAYIKSENIYCYLHFNNGNSRFIPKQLKWVQSRLDTPNFVRIHRSYLININSIAEYKREECGYFVMENEGVVPISRSKRHKVEEIILL